MVGAGRYNPAGNPLKTSLILSLSKDVRCR